MCKHTYCVFCVHTKTIIIALGICSSSFSLSDLLSPYWKINLQLNVSRFDRGVHRHQAIVSFLLHVSLHCLCPSILIRFMKPPLVLTNINNLLDTPFCIFLLLSTTANRTCHYRYCFLYRPCSVSASRPQRHHGSCWCTLCHKDGIRASLDAL